MRTANLRRQHDAAIAIVGEMTGRIEAMGPVPTGIEAFQITMLLARLTGVLRIHFAQEDKMLYPQLMASPHAEVSETARSYVAEMGQIGPAFAAYAERWRTADAIVAGADEFRRETRALFAALGDRIERENMILYPLADQEAIEAAARAA